MMGIRKDDEGRSQGDEGWRKTVKRMVCSVVSKNEVVMEDMTRMLCMLPLRVTLTC